VANVRHVGHVPVDLIPAEHALEKASTPVVEKRRDGLILERPSAEPSIEGISTRVVEKRRDGLVIEMLRVVGQRWIGQVVVPGTNPTPYGRVVTRKDV
jgi:hypothetical protein